jgi:RNA polymerase sigma-70 factor (ECF subfamily)
VKKSDAQLVAESLEGQVTAFDQLMLRYQKLVYSTALAFCHERETAMDLVQSTFLKAYERLPSLAQGDRFKPWLVRIAYNVCHDWLRKKDPLANSLMEDALDDTVPHHNDPLLSGERKEQLSDWLEQLNPKYRLAVALKYFEGASNREIADVFGCSEGVVKNMLYRSLRQMSQLANS